MWITNYEDDLTIDEQLVVPLGNSYNITGELVIDQFADVIIVIDSINLENGKI